MVLQHRHAVVRRPVACVQNQRAHAEQALQERALDADVDDAEQLDQIEPLVQHAGLDAQLPIGERVDGEDERGVRHQLRLRRLHSTLPLATFMGLPCRTQRRLTPFYRERPLLPQFPRNHPLDPYGAETNYAARFEKRNMSRASISPVTAMPRNTHMLLPNPWI